MPSPPCGIAPPSNLSPARCYKFGCDWALGQGHLGFRVQLQPNGCIAISCRRPTCVLVYVVHKPELRAPAAATMTFRCGDGHTSQLSPQYLARELLCKRPVKTTSVEHVYANVSHMCSWLWPRKLSNENG